MIEITTDTDKLDIDLIHRFLSDESYWASGIPRDLVERSIDNSLCFGAFERSAQVGFARVVTDYATFGYLADVFVLPSHRGRGIGRQILQAVKDHPDLQRLRRWHLVTSDAHALYAELGFHEIESPQRHMEIAVKNAYVS
jgi:GNAT superfamily N-acetyltransferase